MDQLVKSPHIIVDPVDPTIWEYDLDWNIYTRKYEFTVEKDGENVCLFDSAHEYEVMLAAYAFQKHLGVRWNSYLLGHLQGEWNAKICAHKFKWICDLMKRNAEEFKNEKLYCQTAAD